MEKENKALDNYIEKQMQNAQFTKKKDKLKQDIEKQNDNIVNVMNNFISLIENNSVLSTQNTIPNIKDSAKRPKKRSESSMKVLPPLQDF